jgi:hypothetical protein
VRDLVQHRTIGVTVRIPTIDVAEDPGITGDETPPPSIRGPAA